MMAIHVPGMIVSGVIAMLVGRAFIVTVRGAVVVRFSLLRMIRIAGEGRERSRHRLQRQQHEHE